MTNTEKKTVFNIITNVMNFIETQNKMAEEEYLKRYNIPKITARENMIDSLWRISQEYKIVK